MRNPTSIPNVIPPKAPPTIMPVLGEALLLSVSAIELDVLTRAVIPVTVV